MSHAFLKSPPFDRGQTFNEDGWHTMTSTLFDELEGKIAIFEDTVHMKGGVIWCMIVRNSTGGAITVARKCVEFTGGGATYSPHKIQTFPCNTAGAVALPIDDAYTVGKSIAANDLFYVVCKGWCDILTGAAVTNLASNVTVTVDNAGLIANKAAPAAGEAPIGVLGYAASYSASTASEVYVTRGEDLAMPPAAG